jgi:hypothetical protein
MFAKDFMDTRFHALHPCGVVSKTDLMNAFYADFPSESNASSPDRISGVLALSDAARFRSGSCRACTAGRMLAC